MPATTDHCSSADGYAKMRPCTPNPKFSLTMMSGAMMRVTSRFASVCTQVGINPKVEPLFGSVEISGTGMNGAVAGLNQRDNPLGGVASTGNGPCGTSTGVGAGGTSASPAALDRQGAAPPMRAAATPA